MAQEKQKRGRKYDQVIEGAMDVFLAKGFEGASVDEIASTAGVSKATLYSYFPDKQSLYAAMTREKCQQRVALAHDEIDWALPPRELMTLVAQKIISEMLSEFNRSVFRVAIGEAQRFPNLANEFYECGVKLTRDALVNYLAKATQSGVFDIDDLDLAGEQFLELCKGKLFIEFILGVRETFPQEEQDQVAHEAVKMFFARYARQA